MENTSSILTIREVAEVLRCSRAHVQKALGGKVAGVPQLAHVNMGRRKLVRKEWLEQWMEEGKTGSAARRQRNESGLEEHRRFGDIDLNKGRRA